MFSRKALSFSRAAPTTLLFHRSLKGLQTPTRSFFTAHISWASENTEKATVHNKKTAKSKKSLKDETIAKPKPKPKLGVQGASSKKAKTKKAKRDIDQASVHTEEKEPTNNVLSDPKVIELLREDETTDQLLNEKSLDSRMNTDELTKVEAALKRLLDERNATVQHSNENEVVEPGETTQHARETTETEAHLRRVQSIALNLALSEISRLKTASPGAEAGISHNAMPPEEGRRLAIPAQRAKKKKLGNEKKVSQRSFEAGIRAINAKELNFKSLEVFKPSIPSLAHGLDRVLFNPGVYYLRDPRSKVYNFDPYLEKLMPVSEFDFTALREYKESSRDTRLIDIAKEHGKKYAGSTSSMTAVLSHFHFLLSQWRPIDARVLSRNFEMGRDFTTFSQFTKSPTSIFLRWKDGSYAIDYDKEFSDANVLMKLGHSLEKLLTSSTKDFERYRRSSLDQVPAEKRGGEEAYHFSTQGDLIMRSQLDAHDPRLPGSGVFDLKTRAVVSIRFNPTNIDDYTGYQLRFSQGDWESFEREHYDMMRTALLKYSLQVRMGRMNGIFVAYHNVERMFGFQYMDIHDMDRALHGDESQLTGDQEFRLSLDLLNKILNVATTKYPEQSLRMHFETRSAKTPFMYMFAEPMTDTEIENIQEVAKQKEIDFDRQLLGLNPLHPEVTIGDDIDGEWNRMDEDVEEDIRRDSSSVDQASSKADLSDGPDLSVESQDYSITSSTESAATRKPDSEESSEIIHENVEESSREPKAEESNEGSQQDVIESIEPKKSILGMVIAIRNKVNDQYVDRPEKLSPHDTWTVEYALKEIGHLDARKSYNSLKSRKKNASLLSRTDDRIRSFRATLARYSSDGRKVQSRQDELDSVAGRVVYSSPERHQNIEDSGRYDALNQSVNTDSYLTWLYEAGLHGGDGKISRGSSSISADKMKG